MSEAIQKQKKLNKFWLTWNLVESIVLFAGGILAIVAGIIAVQNGGSTNPNIENAIAYVVASFVILDGILRIAMYLLRGQTDEEQSPLVISGFEISLGVLLILIQSKFTAQHIFTYMVVNLIAIILMVMGALLMVYAIYLIAKKHGKLFMPVMEILFSAILVGVGIVIEVLYNTESSREQLVLIMTGSVLCLAAIGMFAITLITRRKTKKEIDLAEKEERGDYAVAKEPIPQKEKPIVEEAKPADIIDAEETEPDKPKAIKGPKGICRKK